MGVFPCHAGILTVNAETPCCAPARSLSRALDGLILQGTFEAITVGEYVVSRPTFVETLRRMVQRSEYIAACAVENALPCAVSRSTSDLWLDHYHNLRFRFVFITNAVRSFINDYRVLLAFIRERRRCMRMRDGLNTACRSTFAVVIEEISSHGQHLTS
jgi:hypothetical protein